MSKAQWGVVPGLIRLSGMELELSELLGGRKVDLNTAKTLSPYSVMTSCAKPGSNMSRRDDFIVLGDSRRR